MSNYIGIDFGMQNLKVCYFDGRKNSRVDLEGNQSSSSKVSKNAVYYCENENNILLQYFFGAEQAEFARKWNDPDYIRYVKRELQKENYTRSICDGKYSFTVIKIITDIFRQIFNKMKESRYDISAPTILSVPIVFSEAQKLKLQFCAEKAGFNVQEIITEPFAALFSEEIFEACTEDIENGSKEYVLIFDFGASTLDICLLKLENDDDTLKVETISSTGLSLGGKDITDEITNFLIEKSSELINEEVSAGRLDKASTYVEFFELAEELKNELYEEEDTPEAKKRFYSKNLTLKRTNVDKLLDNMKIWDKIEYAIEDMFNSTDEFDSDDYSIVTKLVMTGGSSKIQYFRDKLENMFEDAELVGDLEEEDTIYCSVSSGAVNYANMCNVDIRNSVPMSIGISIDNGFEKALNRNSFYNIPGKRKYISYEWLVANNWRVKVYQTLLSVREHADLNNNDILFAGFIQLNKALYQDFKQDIVLQIKYVPSGIVACTALADEINNVIEDNIALSTEVVYE